MKCAPKLRIDCHTHVGVELSFYLRGCLPYACDYRTLVGQSRRHGVPRLIVFPFVGYLGWEGLGISASALSEGDEDFSVPYAFENRRLLKEIYELNPDIAGAAIPFAIVDPARGQARQVEALRKLRDRYPIRGLKIQATIIRSPILSLLEEGSCLLDLAEEWNIPVLIHSSIAPSDIWSRAGDILDIAERRSGIRICLAHSCRFDLPSLERLGSLPNTWFDCSAHAIHCDAAQQNDLRVVASPERRLTANYADPAEVLRALYDLLPSRLMWGSDAPFYSYVESRDGKSLRLQSSYEREINALSLLSDREKDAVMHDNTLAFLGETDV